MLHPYLNSSNDAGRYMVLGSSLAKTGDFRLINAPTPLRDTLYVPGLPLIIAFWMKITNGAPGDVVVPVKLTLLVFLLAAMPFLLDLMERAQLPRKAVFWGMVAFATCPAVIAYTNEIMSEIPMLSLCLISVSLAERHRSLRIQHKNSEAKVRSPYVGLLVALIVAGSCYYIRAAGVVLLFCLVIWLIWNREWLWIIGGLIVILLTIGFWQIRCSQIIREDPPESHDTYLRQFTLRDPMKPNSGRVELNFEGFSDRVQRNFGEYIGNISRAPLYLMAPYNTPWLVVFITLAIPMTLLVFVGMGVAVRKGFLLSVGFCCLFWVFIALWPWRSPRFLVPLIPFILLFTWLGIHLLLDWLGTRFHPLLSKGLAAASITLLLTYHIRVFWEIAPKDNVPPYPGYSFGRKRDEAGFYAACEWLKLSKKQGVVMGRPAYLIYLYTEKPTIQIEPVSSPETQESLYMVQQNVRFLLIDRWSWSNTSLYLEPYLGKFKSRWKEVWSDPKGSGVRILERK